MTTKAKNKGRRRPVGRKPGAGTRRGGKRVPSEAVTRPSRTGMPGRRPYAQPLSPPPPISEDIGGSDRIGGSGTPASEEGGWGE